MATKMQSEWKQWVRRAATLAILSAMSSCGGLLECLSCAIEDQRFYIATWLYVAPGEASVGAGEDATAVVSVGYDKSLAGGFASHGDRVFHNYQGVSIVPPNPGVTLVPSTDVCVATAAVPVADPFCATYRLNVSAAAIAAGVREFTISAIWTTQYINFPFTSIGDRTIERVATFRISLTGPLPPVPPDFQVAVGTPPGGVYATVATLPITITRVGGFAEAVTLDYFPLSSGIGGGFIAEPVPTDRRSLQLQIPAKFGGGGRVDLRVKATAAGGQTRTLDFPLFIDPLLRLEVQPASASLTTASPLRVEVGVEPGTPFRTTSLGPVELSFSPLTPLPPGVTHQFLSDAMPVGPVLPILKVFRTLQLVTDGRPPGVMGPLTLRATARGLPADIYGDVPFAEITLDLTVRAGQLWQFVGNNLTYGTREANVIGIALQSDNRPALAWLEGTSGRVLMRRYDGTTFAPSPPLADLGFGLTAPALSVPSSIEEAAFALTATDAAQVAFTYQRGATLSLGRAGRAGTAWSLGPPFVVGDPDNAATPRARSPRVVAGPFADAVVVSYIREADATTSGGELHVLSTFGNGVLGPLPGLPPSGTLNATAGGRVLRNAALALRADGNAWVAWVEEPAPAAPPQLWLRAHDGAVWGPAIAVPTTPGTALGASVQLLVEPSGMVAVAWLESGPAQLMVRRYDPSSMAWSPPDVTSNLIGSLNVTGLSPALDVHLAREPGAQGRLLATWTEGDAFPGVWIKRREADGSWRLVGTTISQSGRWSKTPRIVSDTNNRLYVAWATYAAGQNPGTFLPYAEIDVAQWIFP